MEKRHETVVMLAVLIVLILSGFAVLTLHEETPIVYKTYYWDELKGENLQFIEKEVNKNSRPFLEEVESKEDFISMFPERGKIYFIYPKLKRITIEESLFGDTNVKVAIKEFSLLTEDVIYVFDEKIIFALEENIVSLNETCFETENIGLRSFYAIILIVVGGAVLVLTLILIVMSVEYCYLKWKDKK